MVSKGTIVYAIDEKRLLTVDGVWSEGLSSIDFQATYKESNIVDYSGQKIYPNRGFRFKDEGVIWRLAKPSDHKAH